MAITINQKTSALRQVTDGDKFSTVDYSSICGIIASELLNNPLPLRKLINKVKIESRNLPFRGYKEHQVRDALVSMCQEDLIEIDSSTSIYSPLYRLTYHFQKSFAKVGGSD